MSVALYPSNGALLIGALSDEIICGELIRGEVIGTLSGDEIIFGQLIRGVDPSDFPTEYPSTDPTTDPTASPIHDGMLRYII